MCWCILYFLTFLPWCLGVFWKFGAFWKFGVFGTFGVFRTFGVIGKFGEVQPEKVLLQQLHVSDSDTVGAFLIQKVYF